MTKQLCFCLAVIGAFFGAQPTTSAQEILPNLRSFQNQMDIASQYAPTHPLSLKLQNNLEGLGILRQHSEPLPESFNTFLLVLAVVSWTVELVATIGSIYSLSSGRHTKAWGLAAMISSGVILTLTMIFCMAPPLLPYILIVAGPSILPFVLGIAALTQPSARWYGLHQRHTNPFAAASARSHGFVMNF